MSFKVLHLCSSCIAPLIRLVASHFLCPRWVVVSVHVQSVNFGDVNVARFEGVEHVFLCVNLRLPPLRRVVQQRSSEAAPRRSPPVPRSSR
eukprot:2461434-Pleurochrysis_carterae.AAC.2